MYIQYVCYAHSATPECHVTKLSCSINLQKNKKKGLSGISTENSIKNQTSSNLLGSGSEL